MLTIELEIFNEGVIRLRCIDYLQRIKWFECLHAVIFNVERPLFMKKKGLWRINESQGNNNNNNKRNSTIQNISTPLSQMPNGLHIRMGQSLVLSVRKLKSLRTLDLNNRSSNPSTPVTPTTPTTEMPSLNNVESFSGKNDTNKNIKTIL